MKNKYIFRSRISEKKFREILRLFCLDIEAVKVAKLSGISRQTINKLFDRIRQLIADESEKNNVLGSGEVEFDESYFGPRRQKGVVGRGAKNKVPVFGMLKRNGKVYTQIVKNVSYRTILPIIEERVDRDATVYTDSYWTYDGLVDFGYKKHHRIRHGDNEFARGRTHINGIENFWGLCKVRLTRFRGIKKDKFYLHLKECEFRYNMRNEDMYKNLLKLIRKNPLKLS